jgi:hypothetical protein
MPDRAVAPASLKSVVFHPFCRGTRWITLRRRLKWTRLGLAVLGGLIVVEGMASAGTVGVGTTAAPAGGTIFTTSFVAEVDTIVNTPVTQEIDTYSLELQARMLGRGLLYDQPFSFPLGSVTVQSAIAAAEAVLTGAGAVSFLGPTQLSSVESLVSSVLNVVQNGKSLSNEIIGTSIFIGPQTILIGDFGVCQSYTLDANNRAMPSGCDATPLSFDVAAGGVDVDTFDLPLYNVNQTTTTTNPDLFTQVYEIDGVTAPSNTSGSGTSDPDPLRTGVDCYRTPAEALDLSTLPQDALIRNRIRLRPSQHVYGSRIAGLGEAARSLHRCRALICVNPNQMGEDGQASSGDITLLLRQWSDGQDGAFQQLLPLAYERLRMMAYASMRKERPDHTLQPTALIGELYLRLANREAGDWKDRQHFYSFCARAMLDPHRPRSRPVDRKPLCWIGKLRVTPAASGIAATLDPQSQWAAAKQLSLNSRVNAFCTKSPEAGSLQVYYRAEVEIAGSVTGNESDHLNVVATSNDTTPVARPKSRPEANTVCGAEAFMMTSLPPPGGSANKVAEGIVSCPSLDGA